MKKLIYIGLILFISCHKTDIAPMAIELPLNNRLSHTTGFNVNLSAEVYPHIATNGTFFAINAYASDTARADYILTVKWTDGNGNVLTSDAIVHNNFSACLTYTSILATPNKVTDAKIIGVKCSDSRYKFTF